MSNNVNESQSAEETVVKPRSYKERKRWLFFGLPFTFTKYEITEDLLTISSGFFKTTVNDCYMYKVQDVELSATLAEKMVGVGTVTCFTGDTTHPKLLIEHVRHAKEIKNFILEESERARIKRRTVNMLDIGTGTEDDLGDAHATYCIHDGDFHGLN